MQAVVDLIRPVRKNVGFAAGGALRDGGQHVGNVAYVKIIVPRIDRSGQPPLYVVDKHLRHMALAVVAGAEHAREHQYACIQAARAHGIQNDLIRLALGARISFSRVRRIGRVIHFFIRKVSARESLGRGDMQQLFCAVCAASVDDVLRAAHGHAVQFLGRSFADRHLCRRMDHAKRPVSVEQLVHVSAVGDIAEHQFRRAVGIYGRRFFRASCQSDDAASLSEQLFRQYVAHIASTAGHDVSHVFIHFSAPSCFFGPNRCTVVPFVI